MTTCCVFFVLSTLAHTVRCGCLSVHARAVAARSIMSLLDGILADGRWRRAAAVKFRPRLVIRTAAAATVERHERERERSKVRAMSVCYYRYFHS